MVFSNDCCQYCQLKVSAEELEQYTTLKSEFKRLVLLNQSGHPEPEEQCEDFFKEMKKVFHPYDKTYLDLLELLYEQRISAENYQGALEVACLILKHYRRNYPKFDINTALMALKIAICS